MTFNPKTTVSELALGVPNATRVFEKMGIDYCCGGTKSLADACASASVSMEDVLNSLREATSGGSPAVELKGLQSAPLVKLIAYIIDKHHVFTRQELARLDALLVKVCDVHGHNHPELLRVQKLFRILQQDLLMHMQKEEIVLFPHIMRMEESVSLDQPVPVPPFGTVRNPVRMMSLEHDTAGELLRAIRMESANYAVPNDACASYRTLYQALRDFEKDLHQHIFLENSILFPRAVELEMSA